jgi:hypothetical protein
MDQLKNGERIWKTVHGWLAAIPTKDHYRKVSGPYRDCESAMSAIILGRTMLAMAGDVMRLKEIGLAPDRRYR